MGKNRRRRTAEEKAAIVRRFKASGLSQEAFAKQIAVSGNSIGKWLRLERQGHLLSEPQDLIPVRVTPSRSANAVPLEIVLKNGRTLRVPAGFDEQALVRVVTVLERC